MLQSMRSREKWRCTERSQTDKYYICRAHSHKITHWTIGPGTLRRALLTQPPSPATPAGGVRGNAGGPSTIDPSIQFNSVQSDPISAYACRQALHALPGERSSSGPCICHRLTRVGNNVPTSPLGTSIRKFGATSIREKELGTDQDKRIRYVKSKRVA